MDLIRSYLFVPANSKKKMEKSLYTDVDAVIFDLEDAVKVSEKNYARSLLNDFLGELETTKKIYVRINECGSNDWLEDMKIVSESKIDGIILPKSEGKNSILNTISYFENKQINIIPIIETALGVLKIREIAESSAMVERLALGGVDLALDLNMQPTEQGFEFLFVRTKLVLYSKVAGIAPPIDSVCVDYSSDSQLKYESSMAKNLGFSGKLLIHPTQIDVVNDTFNITIQELEQAKKIVELYEKNSGSTSLNGSMIDYPIYKRSKNLLSSLNKC